MRAAEPSLAAARPRGRGARRRRRRRLARRGRARACSTRTRRAAPSSLFELQLKPLLKAARRACARSTTCRAIPAVELDLALVVPEDVTAERVEQAIRSAGGKLLEGVRLFDVYRGAGVAEGRKSLAFALTYRAADRTLTDEEVAAVHDKLVRKVTGAVGGELRA